MVHGTPRHTDNRWHGHEGRTHGAIIYLIGTVGVGIVIALGLIVAQNAGWLDGIQTALRQIELPGLPRAPQAGPHDVLQGLTDKVRNVEQSTHTLWQRGSERTQPSGGSQASTGRRRD